MNTILSAMLTCGAAMHAQEPQTPSPEQSAEPSPAAAPSQTTQTEQNNAKTCVQPAPMLRLEDYDGKFSKLVGTFARKLERKSVHAPHYKPGAVLCTLETKDKFFLFLEDTLDPATFLGTAFNAGIGQAQNSDPSYGQGSLGYAHRFGANLADEATGEFFKDFLYPTLFKEDPRYYRQAHGSAGKRLLHAVGHTFVAYHEDGTRTFGASQWLGSISSALVSNTYHPDTQRGVAPFASRVGLGLLNGMGYDVLREFWPQISRKLKLPFRGQDIVEIERPVSPTP